jgi:hypothetical protein
VGVKFNGPERYWEVIIVLNYLGNQIAHRLGLVQYTPEAGTEWAIRQLDGQRGYVQAAQYDAQDMIFEYLNQNNGLSLTVFDSNGKSVMQEPPPRGEVHIRKEIVLNSKGRAEHGKMYYDRFHFQRWLVERGYDLKQVLEEIHENGSEFVPNKYGKIYMGKGTQLKLGQVRVVGFNLSHEKFRGMLELENGLDLMPASERTNVLKLR